MENQDKNWPAWRYGPNGKSAVFESAKDVPNGWHDHPSKVGSNAGAARTATQPANVTTTEQEAAKTTTEKGTSQDPCDHCLYRHVHCSGYLRRSPRTGY